MKWIEIDKTNLPKCEVIAANFKPNSYGYKEKVLGYLSLLEDGEVVCESDSEMIGNCTHYFDINKYDVEA